MTDESDLDSGLRAALGGVRQHDIAETPAFGPMIARARVEAAAMLATVPNAATRGRTRPGLRAIVWGAPVVLAAGIGAILVVSDRMKDREFERVVSEWSASEVATQSPTDQLLVLPGSEFLGRLPAVGRPDSRRGM
ncbi:MAG: hypothetical protein ACT4OZ_17250 [Gemmatimonadota bacterium]